MKPYQVKLRIIGIMSIIVSLLVLWLPLPSKAVDVSEPTKWQKFFKYKTATVSTINYIDLETYEANNGTDIDTPLGRPEDSALTAEGMLTIPDAAVETPEGGSLTSYVPRIGKEK